ncbi:MAG: DUF1080 domain-containing protein [FCB group bacterium]|jgi:hypothetical protein|nr:DUF1080 domain-containing protein [FCB group bacterium]
MRLAFVAACAILAAVGAVGQEPEFTPLFNGTDLTGWQPFGGEWSVADQQIVGRVSGDKSAWLLHTGEYSDFEVELEFRTPVPANGGLQFRSHWLPKEPVPQGIPQEQLVRDMYGYQANIDPKQLEATGAVVAKHGDPPLAIASAEAQAALKPTDWNTLRVRAVGDTFEVSVNGAISCRVTNDRFVRGAVGLQVFPTRDAPMTEVFYRNIRIKDLGRGGNWRPLFNGTDLAGWKVWGEEKWSVQDGAILGQSGPKQSEGYLATEERFKDFHVRGSFKMLGAGNFGLFYHATIQYDEKQYPVIAGVQGEVDPNYPGPTGWIYESYKRGWLVQPDLTTAASYALRVGQWNEIEIRSIGNRNQTWVNGFPVVDFTDPAPQLFEGSLALQLHTGGVDGITWKDIFVKP